MNKKEFEERIIKLLELGRLEDGSPIYFRATQTREVVDYLVERNVTIWYEDTINLNVNNIDEVGAYFDFFMKVYLVKQRKDITVTSVDPETQSAYVVCALSKVGENEIKPADLLIANNNKW